MVDFFVFPPLFFYPPPPSPSLSWLSWNHRSSLRNSVLKSAKREVGVVVSVVFTNVTHHPGFCGIAALDPLDPDQSRLVYNLVFCTLSYGVKAHMLFVRWLCHTIRFKSVINPIASFKKALAFLEKLTPTYGKRMISMFFVGRVLKRPLRVFFFFFFFFQFLFLILIIVSPTKANWPFDLLHQVDGPSQFAFLEKLPDFSIDFPGFVTLMPSKKVGCISTTVFFRTEVPTYSPSYSPFTTQAYIPMVSSFTETSVKAHFDNILRGDKSLRISTVKSFPEIVKRGGRGRFISFFTHFFFNLN